VVPVAPGVPGGPVAPGVPGAPGAPVAPGASRSGRAAPLRSAGRRRRSSTPRRAAAESSAATSSGCSRPISTTRTCPPETQKAGRLMRTPGRSASPPPTESGMPSAGEATFHHSDETHLPRDERAETDAPHGDGIHWNRVIPLVALGVSTVLDNNVQLDRRTVAVDIETLDEDSWEGGESPVRVARGKVRAGSHGEGRRCWSLSALAVPAGKSSGSPRALNTPHASNTTSPSCSHATRCPMIPFGTSTGSS